MTISFFLSFSLRLYIISLFPGETCPPGWVTRSDGKACFYIANGLERNWTHAESYCVARKGHLVSIMNTMEQQEIEGNTIALSEAIFCSR